MAEDYSDLSVAPEDYSDLSVAPSSIAPPTAGEKAAALGIGAAEAVGRWPGELMSAAAEIGKQQLLGPIVSRIPGLSQAITASTERALQPAQNLTPKTFNTLSELIGSDKRYYDPNAPQLRSPEYAAVGEFLPNLASLFIRGPTGVRPATTIGQIGKEAASMAGAGTQPLVSQLSKVAKRLPQTEDDILHFVTDAPSSPKDFKPKLTSGDFDEVLPDLAAQKTGSGLPGVIDANTKLNQESISFVNPLVKGYPAESLVFNEENIISQARQKLTSSNPNYNIPIEELRNNALDQVRIIIKDINPENYTDTATYTNNKLTDLYKSLEPEKYADQKKALRAVRDVLGDGVKTIIKDRGADPTVWSQYGLRNQLVDRMSDVHEAADLAYKTSRGEGLIGKQGVEPTDIIHKIPFVSSGLRISKNLMERVTGGQPEFLNKRIDQLFNKIKPSTAPITGVTPSQRGLLLEGSSEQRSANLAQQKAIQDRAKVLADQGATPAEVNAYLNEQNQGLSLSQAIQESIPKSMAIQRQSVKQFESAVKARPTDDVLSDMIHFRNKGEFGYSSMLERELERRLGAKKYSKDWNLIKENLGIPQSVEGIDLPRKREILQ